MKDVYGSRPPASDCLKEGKQLSTDFDAFAFIVGCGHSGTSLLANMFAAHPLAYVPLRETRAFDKASKMQARWSVVLNEARNAERRFIVEKTPIHLHKMDRIRGAVPRARFIVMVRDGRDVAYSFIRRAGAAKVGVDRWLADNEVVARERLSPDVYLVRYEDLIQNPEAILRESCAFIGVPYDAAMVEYHAQERLWFGQSEVRNPTSDAHGGHGARRNWQINQPLFDGRGQWRGKLSAIDLEPFGTPPGRQLMLSFGYDPEVPPMEREASGTSDPRTARSRTSPWESRAKEEEVSDEATHWLPEAMIPITRPDGTPVTSFSSPPSWRDEVRRQGLRRGEARAPQPVTWADLVSELHHGSYGRPWLLGRFTVNELIRRGIRRDRPLLDIGCGAGRMGGPLIEYLDANMYYGQDCHLASLVAFAAYEAAIRGLAVKQPKLMIDEDFSVRTFGKTFETVVDFAVTMHLGSDIASRAYVKIREVTATGGRLFITQRTVLDPAVMRQIGFTLVDESIVKYALPVTDSGRLGEDRWFEFRAT